MVHARPYQQAAIDAALAYLSPPCDATRRYLVGSPTGSGKSVIGMGVAMAMVHAGRRVFIATHRIHLVPQWVEHAKRAGISPGVIRAGIHPDPDARLQIGTVQTFRRRAGALGRFDLIVADEAHRADVSEPAFRMGVDVLGLTATPIGTGATTLGHWYERMHIAATPSELLAGGWIVPADMWCPYVPDLSQVKMRGKEFEERSLENVMATRALTGNVVEHWEKLARGVPTIAFAVSVHHANLLCEAFRAAGHGAAVISGDTPEDDREHIQRRFSVGSLDVLVNCAIFVEGYDLPAVGAVIMARPTNSLALFLQMAGRGARPEKGKTRYRLLDHAGNVFRHQAPHMDRLWNLQDESLNGKEAAAARETQGLRHCGTCFYCWSGTGACPNCGSTAPPRRVKEKAGTLVHVEEKQLAALLPAGQQAKEAIDKKRRALFARSKHMPVHKRYAWVQAQLKQFVEDLSR